MSIELSSKAAKQHSNLIEDRDISFYSTELPSELIAVERLKAIARRKMSATTSCLQNLMSMKNAIVILKSIVLAVGQLLSLSASAQSISGTPNFLKPVFEYYPFVGFLIVFFMVSHRMKLSASEEYYRYFLAHGIIIDFRDSKIKQFSLFYLVFGMWFIPFALLLFVFLVCRDGTKCTPPPISSLFGAVSIAVVLYATTNETRELENHLPTFGEVVREIGPTELSRFHFVPEKALNMYLNFKEKQKLEALKSLPKKEAESILKETPALNSEQKAFFLKNNLFITPSDFALFYNEGKWDEKDHENCLKLWATVPNTSLIMWEEEIEDMRVSANGKTSV